MMLFSDSRTSIWVSKSPFPRPVAWYIGCISYTLTQLQRPDPLHQVSTDKLLAFDAAIMWELYHAYVIAIQQDFWELGVVARIVAVPQSGYVPAREMDHTYNSVTSSSTMSKNDERRSLSVNPWTLTDVVIETEKSATEFCKLLEVLQAREDV